MDKETNKRTGSGNTRILITRYQSPRIKKTCLVTGILEGERLMEVHCEDPESPSILGNIYVGRVEKVMPDIHAAFVEINRGVKGYLPLEDCRNPVFIKKINSPSLVQGDELLVQVAKENLKTKLPVLTANISFTGSYLVLTTGNQKLGVSAKIRKEKKEELKALFADIPRDDFGIILRTNAKDADSGVLMEEFHRLCGELKQLVEQAGYRTCFSCLKQSPPEYLNVLKNSYYAGLNEIVTDIPEIYEDILGRMGEILDREGISVRLYEDPMLPLGALYNLDRQIIRGLDTKVWLKSGGYLIIEPTEALTVIDVNTGKSVTKKKPQEHFLKLNKEAAAEIALQLRLRNISGIIIIDFIDLKRKEDRAELMKTLAEAVGKDPVPVQVVDMTPLNLVELTRKKVSKSLKEQLT